MSAELLDQPADAIRRAVAGDQAAFTAIIRAYHDDMTRVAYLITGDLDVADDAVQAAWSIAWQKLGGLRQPDRLRSWLVSVAANEARQIVRRRRRAVIVELQVADGSTSSIGDPAGAVDDLDLANALAALSTEDRMLLALRYVAGFDATELGRATGRSPSGTRARLGRILARLRTELNHD